MRAKYFISGLLVVVGMLAVFFVTGTEETVVLEERIRPVRTTHAINTPSDVKQRYAGGTRASSTSSISFRVPGIISEFPAQVGIPLKKQTLIARLDNNDYRIKLKQEQAVLAREIVDAENAESRFRRIEKLFEENVISEMDYETVRAEYHISLAEVTQTRRNVELSQEQLQYTELRTPADNCSITEATAAQHENVTAGQVVAVLSCGDMMEVIAAVPESAVSQTVIGQPVEAILNTPNEKIFKAQVTDIGISSAANGVYLVTARLLDDSPFLRPGMAAELVLTRKFEKAADHVWVPMVTVGEDNGQRYVMIYEPIDEFTGTVKKLPVTTDRMVMGLLEITSGLTSEQLIITAGLSQIQEGLVVKLLKSN